MSTTSETDLAKLIREEAEHADLAQHDPIPEGASGTRPNRAVVYSLRLPAETVAKIEKMAADLDVPPTTFARGLILEGLATKAPTGLTIDQVADELIELSSVLRGKLQTETPAKLDHLVE